MSDTLADKVYDRALSMWEKQRGDTRGPAPKREDFDHHNAGTPAPPVTPAAPASPTANNAAVQQALESMQRGLGLKVTGTPPTDSTTQPKEQHS